MTHNIQEADEKAFQSKLDNIPPEKLLNQSILILQKPMEARTRRDIEVLQKWTEKFDFFQNFAKQKGDALHAELCKHLNYEISKVGDIVFEAGSVGTKLYAILRGAVEVSVNTLKLSTEGKDVVAVEKIDEFKEGDIFGESAIMDDPLKPRKVTIKTISDCVLATLEKEDYQRIFGFMAHEINGHVDFLEGLPHFKNTGWSNRTLQNIVKNFDKYVYSRSHVIYKEGDPCDEVFLIRSGEVKCTKSVQMAGDNKNFVVDENSNLYPFDEAPAKKVAEVSIFTAGQLFGEEEALLYVINRKDLSFRLTQYLKSLTVLKELFGTQNQHIMTPRGEEKLLFRKNSFAQQVARETQVTVNSLTAEVWRMPAKIFFTLIDSYKNTLDSIIATILGKRKRREDRIAEIIENVPLQHVSITRSPEYLKANIVSFTKHKKYIGSRQSEQMVYCNMSFDGTTNRESQEELFQRSGSGSPTPSPRAKLSPNKSQVHQPSGFFSPRNTRSGFHSPSRANSPPLEEPTTIKSPRKSSQSPIPNIHMRRAFSTAQKSSKKILMVDNPLINNSSFGHGAENHSQLSLRASENRVSNKQNDVPHYDCENFFNNSIRVRKVTYGSARQSAVGFRSKSQLSTLEKDKKATNHKSNLLPQLKNSRQYSKKDLKNDVRLGTTTHNLSGTISHNRSTLDHDDEDSLNLVSGFIAPKDAKAYEKRKQRIQASFRSASTKPSPRDISPIKFQDTAQVLIKSLQMHRDLFMRKPPASEDPLIAGMGILSSISQAVQAKKAGILLGKESLPTSASGQVSFRQKAQDIRGNTRALRQTRLKYYDLPPEALKATQMHPLNRTQEMSQRSQRSHRDKLKNIVQGKLGEKFKISAEKARDTSSNKRGRYEEYY